MRSTGNIATWQTIPKSSGRASSIKKVKCIVLGGANAGKTSILRKYFHGNFDPTRLPTVGSDFYTKKMADPTSETYKDSGDTLADEKKEASSVVMTQRSDHPKAMLSMQVWDTPGRERYAANQTKPMYTAAFSDNFFKNADAAVLVYDITSSTSFTHVLRWYEDLMMRIRRLEASGERTRPFPVLIVGNKIDILRDRDTHPSTSQVSVPQRDVMGMAGKVFRGKDYQYEYKVSAPRGKGDSNSSMLSISPTTTRRHRHRHELSTYMGTGDQTNYLQAVYNNEVQIGSYLESLLSTEDGSHPDKDMVLLWCMRNGLKHMEVSALDGTGINELMEAMIAEAMDATTKHAEEKNEKSKALAQSDLRRNDELDLHRRYAPKAENCFMLPFRICPRPWSKQRNRWDD